jgi:hypothetical protein
METKLFDSFAYFGVTQSTWSQHRVRQQQASGLWEKVR